jgi:hypothetical protein
MDVKYFRSIEAKTRKDKSRYEIYREELGIQNFLI